ncbi:HTTM domain-containing protein, partial [Streptomyces massasporeus]
MSTPTPGFTPTPGSTPAAGPAPASPFAPTRARGRAPEPFDRRLARAVQNVTGRALGPYQTAIVRIGFSLTWLVFLLRELPFRHELYGPDGPWSWEMARRLIADNRSFSVLMWSDGRLWFELVYGLAVLSAVLLLLGWRTRAV